MKTKTMPHPARGAALLIAVAAAMVVMLAVGILFALMDRMISDQLRRERDAQVSLSEASALEALVYRAEREGPLEVHTTLSFSSGGVLTRVIPMSLDRVDLRRLTLHTGGMSVPQVYPSGRYLFSVSQENGLVIHVFPGNRPERSRSFRLQRDPRMLLGTPIHWNGREALLLILDLENEQELHIYSPEGPEASLTVQGLTLKPDAVITVGTSEGTPRMVLTNGSNQADAVDLSTGLIQRLFSPSGTCPVILPSGEIFGDPHHPSALGLALPVTHVAFTDANRDGRNDVVWAGPRSLWVRTAQGLFSGSPSILARLEAWGSVEGSLGLGARWSLPNTEDVWTRFTLNGFSRFEPMGVLQSPWTGRFFGRGTLLAGTLNGEAVLASLSGSHRMTLFPDENLVWGDADGWGVDLFAPEAGRVHSVCNPLAGDGFAQIFRMHSQLDGVEYHSQHRLLIYDGGERFRVFTEREGVQRP